ncbi:MAG: MBL fold metallo-hydrolase [Halioglobus sp.]
MKNLSAMLLAACACAMSLQVLAETPDKAPSVAVSEIKDGIYLLQGRGGNVVAFTGADGVLLIDNDYAPLAGAYVTALEKVAPEVDAPQYVINTHWHSDHTGNNGFWAQKNSVLVAQVNVRERMSTRQDMKTLDTVVEPSPAKALPVITYDSSMALHFNGEDIQLEHFANGHTDGDSVVFFSKANVVHVGDHFFLDAFPFVDMDSGGNLASYVANVGALLDRFDADTIIVPGHGTKVASKADLQRFHDMILATSTIVQEGTAKGLSVDQLVQRGLGEEWATWGKGFVNEALWIQTIAASQ